MEAGIRRHFAAILQADRHATTRYGLAAASILAALLFTGLLSTTVQGGYFLLALTTIMMSSFYCGPGPGIAASVMTGIGFAGIFLKADRMVGGEEQPGCAYRLCLFELAALLACCGGSLVRAAHAERKAAQRTARQAGQAAESSEVAETRFRLLVNSLHDCALFLLDPEGRILSWNLGAEHLMGYPTGEIIGRHFSTLYPAEGAGRDRPDVGLLVATRDGRFEEESLQVRKGGSSFLAHIVITALFDDRGQVWGFSAVTRDRSANRRAEEERERLTALLHEARSARDEFLSLASHELRTPLTTLQLQVQSLTRSVRGEREPAAEPEKMAGKLSMIERQVGRMTELINNLLDVSRMIDGRLRMEIEEVDLAAVVHDVAARLREPLRDAGCELTLHAGTPIVGRWDRLRVEGVVMGLLQNAMKYGRGKPVCVSVSSASGAARLVVRDQGIGIAERDHARIFERFERAVSEQYGGMGVGLWVARQIVDAFGGTIRVMSELGAGSTFLVDLPHTPTVGESPTSTPLPKAPDSDRVA